MSSTTSTRQKAGLFAGPIAACLVYFILPADLSHEARAAAFVVVWTAIWWMTEAMHIAATSLLPMVLLPLSGAAPLGQTTREYSHPVVYLLMGGFILAVAIQRWGLHKRMALALLKSFGRSGPQLIASFMTVAALTSFWITNTATTIMLLPVALSVLVAVTAMCELSEEQNRDFSVALPLCVAYGATIGGMATLIGTAPNAFMASFASEQIGVEIGFASWMLVGVPLVVLLLPTAWFVLTRMVYRVDFATTQGVRDKLRDMYQELGGVSRPEKRVALVFACMAAAWITRPLLQKLPLFAGLSDTIIAIAGALSLLLIPSRPHSAAGSEPAPRLLSWSEAATIPWGVLLTFGGGLAMAKAIQTSGLAAWMALNLQTLDGMPIFIILLVLVALIVFMTELVSNQATVSTFLPIVLALATAISADPMQLTIPVALAASCAFMLPVATPPNSVIFASGSVNITEMMRTGIRLNILAVAILTLAAMFLVPLVF